MLKKLEQIKKQLEQFEVIIKNQNFFGIEEVDINKIKEIKDPVEVEKIIELFLKIRDLSKRFGHVHSQAVQLRIKSEKHLSELIKQKALQKEEPFFYFNLIFIHLSNFLQFFPLF